MGMSRPRNPHLVVTVKCAAPGCANVRRDSNHWFAINIVPGKFLCRPYISTARLRPKDQPVCGQACAQKLLDRFLANAQCHLRPQSTLHRQQHS
jgi:hypothetical protein